MTAAGGAAISLPRSHRQPPGPPRFRGLGNLAADKLRPVAGPGSGSQRRWVLLRENPAPRRAPAAAPCGRGTTDLSQFPPTRSGAAACRGESLGRLGPGSRPSGRAARPETRRRALWAGPAPPTEPRERLERRRLAAVRRIRAMISDGSGHRADTSPKRRPLPRAGSPATDTECPASPGHWPRWLSGIRVLRASDGGY